MAWTNLTFFAEEKDIDLLSEELNKNGAISVYIQDRNLNKIDEEFIFGEPHSGPNKFWVTNQVQALFDQSIAGIEVKNKPFFSVQYHPESSPGPQDSRYLFKKFENLVEKYA